MSDDFMVDVAGNYVIRLPAWEWDVFGNGMLKVTMYKEQVTWWRRLKTSFFLGSKWKRL